MNQKHIFLIPFIQIFQNGISIFHQIESTYENYIYYYSSRPKSPFTEA